MANIEQIDAAIGKYYVSLNREYKNEFATYCDENCIDHETLISEMNEEPDDSMLVEFDDDFPFNAGSNDNKWKS